MKTGKVVEGSSAIRPMGRNKGKNRCDCEDQNLAWKRVLRWLEEYFFRRLPQHPLAIVGREEIKPVSHQFD